MVSEKHWKKSQTHEDKNTFRDKNIKTQTHVDKPGVEHSSFT